AGEQQLVVLAVVQSVLECIDGVARGQSARILVDRNLRGVDHRTNAAGFADARQVAAEAVAQVDHRVGAVFFGDFAGEEHARLEGQVPSQQAAAHRAGDVDAVGDLCAAPGDR